MQLPPSGVTRRGFLGAHAALAGLFAARAGFQQGTDALATLSTGELRARYDLRAGLTYLNHASIGTVPRAVREAHERYLRECEANPWLYVWGGAWNAAEAEVREDAAAALGCPAEDVAITHNTTEAFNLLAQGLPLGAGDEVLFSSLNHSGASRAWEHHAQVRGYRVRRFDFPLERAREVTRADVVEVYAREIRDETRVLVFPHIDNTLGIRHPMREIAARAHAAGVEFVAVDGAQTPGMIPIDLAESGVDFFSTSGHKWLQAPKELGLFAARAEMRELLRPMWVTWGQRSWAGTARVFSDYGTRDLPKLLALGDALRFQEQLGAERKQKHLRELRAHAFERVEGTPHWQWRSPLSWEDGGSLVAVGMTPARRGAGVDAIAQRLFEEHGCVVRPFAGRGLDTLRVSPNVTDSKADLDRFFEALDEVTA